jgi:hypothetical protein
MSLRTADVRTYIWRRWSTVRSTVCARCAMSVSSAQWDDFNKH